MKVPLAWLREFTELPDAEDVAAILAELGFPVAGIERRPAITGVVVGRITELRPHPNADRLQVATVETGSEPLTIATAATNVEAGQIVPVATIGARLPHLTIERRTMRGIESAGMMISADELALAPEWFEDGIMQLDATSAIGEDVVERFGLCEPVLDVEISSNRVDAMSMLGLARELAAFSGSPLRSPSFRTEAAPDDSGAPSVSIESADCLRLVAQRFSGVRVRTGPAWMRIRLALAGQRPINNVVDISNYVMLEIGQPLHLYDRSKVDQDTLIVRDAREGESLVTLDGEERTLTPRALLIADPRQALGLAGLMGGSFAEVSQDTDSILMESANFTGARVRRMSAGLNLRTEAGSRHERSPALWFADAGAARAAELLTQAGAIAHPPIVAGADPGSPGAIELDLADIPRLLGFALSSQECVEYLERLGFGAHITGAQRLQAIPPPWRRDVAVSVDVVEELARVAGYDRIKGSIPDVRAHEISSAEYHLRSHAAATLATLGYREIVSYSLEGAQNSERLLRAGIDVATSAAEVLNPLSEDQRYLRQALMPGMLEYFARIGIPVRIFELGEVFRKAAGGPMESTALTFGFTAARTDEPAWRDEKFLRLKGDCEALIRALTGRSDFEALPSEQLGMHPGKIASLSVGGPTVAKLGAVDPRVAAAFDVRLGAYLCDVYLDALPPFTPPSYRAPSKYPSTYRDLALVCATEVPVAAIERSIAQTLGPLCTSVRAFDEYRGPQVPKGRKSVTVRAVLGRNDATITDAEADAAIDRAVQALMGELQATLRE